MKLACILGQMDGDRIDESCPLLQMRWQDRETCIASCRASGRLQGSHRIRSVEVGHQLLVTRSSRVVEMSS